MDVVLELFDTFLFDPLYATLLPATVSAFSTNATISSIAEAPTAHPQPVSSWHYEPSTQYFSMQPGKYAYMSAWPRDDWRRQLLTLYLITWWVHLSSLSPNRRLISTPQGLRPRCLLHLCDPVLRLRF